MYAANQLYQLWLIGLYAYSVGDWERSVVFDVQLRRRPLGSDILRQPPYAVSYCIVLWLLALVSVCLLGRSSLLPPIDHMPTDFQ